ncbi:GntR family transcriptional regulator [Streptomyces sp. NPDC005373]|uniref:GntR family transcriptional regulator n=1 Tax=unclassified Streptomyces TaxID=2593676 RepID=UPI0033B40803
MIRESVIREPLIREPVIREAALVEKYGVSRGTVRRAVRELETVGHVEARHRVGRFVNSPP